MRITHLTVRDFRNYKEEHFAFSPRVNCILGDNAQGKTNLIEALYLLSTGRSFRTTHLAHLIREGAATFHLSACFESDGVTQTLSFASDGTRREMLHNHTKLQSSAELFGLFPVIIYVPEDVHLITGTPAIRRRFLDMHISQYDPLYVYHLVRYFRAMKQRNFLLKRQSNAAMESWECQMALSAEYVIGTRQKGLNALLPSIQRALEMLSDHVDEVTINYHACPGKKEANSPLSETLARLYATTREKDMRFGSTSLGPHKDDLSLYLNKKEAKIYSSEGQKRSLALALRLAEWERLKEQLGTPPLICLDDFGSHLDLKRQQILTRHLHAFSQTFLTTPQSLPEELAQNMATHYIRAGALYHL